RREREKLVSRRRRGLFIHAGIIVTHPPDVSQPPARSGVALRSAPQSAANAGCTGTARDVARPAAIAACDPRRSVSTVTSGPAPIRNGTPQYPVPGLM